MKRMLSGLLCLMLVLSLLSGCGRDAGQAYVPTGSALAQENGPASQQTVDPALEITMTWYPDRTMNPLKSMDLTNRALFSLLYQGLFAQDRQGTVRPILCSGYTVSLDMKTHTFTVDEAATFSDGSPVTAADAAATLKAAAADGYYAGRFDRVESIAAEDGRLVITTSAPMERLPLLLDVPILKASQVKEDRPVGSGPYVLEPNLEGMQLSRRESWWCEAELPITARAVTLTEAGSAIAIRDSFELAGLDLAYVNPATPGGADYRCECELWDCESGVFYYLGCNMGSAVFSDDSVRAALTHAIDRETLAAEYFHGFGDPATLPASPDFFAYDHTLAQQYAWAPEKFTAAVSAAQLQGQTVVLLVNSDDGIRLRAARSIAQMLTDSALVVELKELPEAQYLQVLENRQYDLYLGQTKLSPNMDLSAFFAPDGALNYGRISGSTFHTLCDQALANSGNYYNLYQTVMDDGRLCPVLFSDYAVYVTRGLLSRLDPGRDNVFSYSLERTLEEITLVEAYYTDEEEADPEL